MGKWVKGIGVFCVVLLIFGLFGGIARSCAGEPVGLTSTVAREPLAASAVEKTSYYTDEDGHRIMNSRELVKGMSVFYEKTGVQPYLYVLPDGTATSTSDLNKRALNLYDELFIDEGHFLLVYCDDDKGSYNFGYAVGSAAQAVMDQEAIDIVLRCLHKELDLRDYYHYKEQAFSEAFEDAAVLLMKAPAPEPPEPRPSQGEGVLLVVAIVAVAGVALFFVLRYARKAERLRKLRDMPLEKFSDQDLEALAKKYEENENPPTPNSQ